MSSTGVILVLGREWIFELIDERWLHVGEMQVVFLLYKVRLRPEKELLLGLCRSEQMLRGQSCRPGSALLLLRELILLELTESGVELRTGQESVLQTLLARR